MKVNKVVSNMPNDFLECHTLHHAWQVETKLMSVASVGRSKSAVRTWTIHLRCIRCGTTAIDEFEEDDRGMERTANRRYQREKGYKIELEGASYREKVMQARSELYHRYLQTQKAEVPLRRTK